VNKKQEVGINPLPNLHLPEGWVLGEVQDLVKIRNGYAFKSEDFNVENGVPVIRQTNLSTDPVNFDKPKFLPEDFLENHLGYKIEKGDVLIGLSGSIGSLSTYREDFPALQNQRTGLLIENVEGSKKYVEYFLLSIKRELNEVAKGVAVQNISSKQIERWPIPIAPPEQQKRIVAEIEKQFSRLDEAVANLKRVKANLKRYKAAVLKAAVEGRLVETEAELARHQGRDFETGEQLLQRILKTRRGQWQGKGKYKEPAAPDTSGLPELPEGWVWATVEQLTWLVTSGSRGWGKFYSDAGVLFIRAQDIKTDELNLATVVRVDVLADAEGTRSSVGVNDILITITGANVTKAAIVTSLSEQAFVSQHVALLKLNAPETASFIYKWIVSTSNGRKILEALAYGAGKPGLSLGQLRSLAVPLPTLAEQHRIVTEVDRRLSLVREVEAQVETNLKRAESLRQSILQQAFTGRLVPSEPIGELVCRLLDGGQKGGKKKTTSKESVSP